MKRIGCLLGICFFLQSTLAQENAIQIVVEETKRDLVFRGVNSSLVQQKVRLKIDTVNLAGYKGPITKYIAPNDTIVMVRLAFKNDKRWSYNTNYNYDPVPTFTQKQEVKMEVLRNVGDLDKGIVLFYDNDCPRCNYAFTYMAENKIPFKLMNIRSESKSQQLMWQLIQMEKPDLTRVQMPVYLVNGAISYDIKDLEGFTSGLLQFRL